VKWLLVIPHVIALLFVGIANQVVLLIAWFAVLSTGKWPEAMRDFVVGFLRWSTQVNAYFYLMTDKYPPFALKA
jgi:Domain of unknown function (DUF4389)